MSNDYLVKNLILVRKFLFKYKFRQVLIWSFCSKSLPYIWKLKLIAGTKQSI